MRRKIHHGGTESTESKFRLMVNSRFIHYNFCALKKTLPTTPLDSANLPKTTQQADAERSPISDPRSQISDVRSEIADPRSQDEPYYLILVVDDSADNLTMISLGLQQYGFRVATATNGAEAVKVAALVNPDLIIMDLAMPEVDGLESTRQIRQNADLKDIPVIALTAFSTEGFRRAAHESGFDGYLTKPVEFDRLHDLIGRLIGLAKSAHADNHRADD